MIDRTFAKRVRAMAQGLCNVCRWRPHAVTPEGVPLTRCTECLARERASRITTKRYVCHVCGEIGHNARSHR